MREIQPDEPVGWLAYKSHQVVVVDPDDRNEQVADRIAQRGRPKARERGEGRLLGSLQLEHHDGDDHRDHGVGERAQTIRIRPARHVGPWLAAIVALVHGLSSGLTYPDRLSSRARPLLPFCRYCRG
jgi:hypothetical protein